MLTCLAFLEFPKLELEAEPLAFRQVSSLDSGDGYLLYFCKCCFLRTFIMSWPWTMPWSCSLSYISSPLTSHLPMCLYAATACCYLCLLSHRLFVLASRLLLFPSPFSLRSFLHVKDEFFLPAVIKCLLICCCLIFTSQYKASWSDCCDTL